MPYPLAYLRMYFTNWLDIDTITKSQTVTLDRQDNKDGNQAYIIKSPLNDDEVFVIEFRKKSTNKLHRRKFIRQRNRWFRNNSI